jgi:hypothetical protein
VEDNKVVTHGNITSQERQLGLYGCRDPTPSEAELEALTRIPGRNKMPCVTIAFEPSPGETRTSFAS